MDPLFNPYRTSHKPEAVEAAGLDAVPYPSADAARPLTLLQHCPAHGVTPLIAAESLAERVGMGAVCLKDERSRMGLGSFKALGAAYVMARHAQESGATDMSQALEGRTYVTASAGNHGMSVAAGSRVFGARAVIYLAETVPEDFAQRLREKGAEVRREGAEYEASMQAAAVASDAENMILLSDSSWDGYTDLPHILMEGYTVMAEECAHQMPAPPTHIFLQAGVGGMAAGFAAKARAAWGDGPKIIVVEPEAAPALMESVRVGHAVVTAGPVSAMGRLDCKEPSLIALKGLMRDADAFVTVSEEQAADAVSVLEDHGISTSPSGCAGVAALLRPSLRDALGLDDGSTVLAIISEGSGEPA
ncbi:MAG: pyridoxal-phosphate dependent enzyme [Pseudomonadota bacterium]